MLVRSQLPFLFFASLLCWLVSSSLSQAEYRVALLIENSDYEDNKLDLEKPNLEKTAAAFETLGFQCSFAKNLPEKELRSAIENFSNRTPVNGTALIYFFGRSISKDVEGKSAIFLKGTSGTGDRGTYHLSQALTAMAERGGSAQQIFIADFPDAPAGFDEVIPENCLITFRDSKFLESQVKSSADLVSVLQEKGGITKSALTEDTKVKGKGSVAVSPPNKFVKGTKAGDEWMNPNGAIFCWCPSGKYTAGSPDDVPGRYADEILREVVIEDGFWISKYELTLTESMKGVPRDTIATHKNHPLTMMHYDDAKTMLHRIMTGEAHKRNQIPADWQYSLPTGDEWEYAARAGTATPFHFGTDTEKLTDHANFGDKNYYESKDIFSNSANRVLDDGTEKLAIVGKYAPNPWGLFDVYGNVAEWCIDCSVRGGSWVSVPEICRSAYRDSYSSRNQQNFIGFRIVLQKTPPEPVKK